MSVFQNLPDFVFFSMEVSFSGCMYFLECSPNTCSDSVLLFSHVYVSLARPWFRWALTI